MKKLDIHNGKLAMSDYYRLIKSIQDLEERFTRVGDFEEYKGKKYVTIKFTKKPSTIKNALDTFSSFCGMREELDKE